MRNISHILSLVALALLAAGSASCVSKGDPQAETAKAPAGKSQSADTSKEQALAILEQSDRYLNPINNGEAGNQGKDLSIPHEGASEAPRNDGIHDPANEAIDVLQDPTKALARFPRDRRQQVDWVAALDQGLIEPRADLLGESQMQTLDLDIIMKNTQYMPYVKFPHLPHTKWLACSNCHPDIFIPKEGANPISMNKVLRGEYCGRCHDKVAFALFICERCHSVPHEESGKWW